jgi:alpha-ketoglutarate-dependent taurine dioxygenase
MLILKSHKSDEEELLEFASSLSTQVGDLKEKILHWDFGPIMNMSYEVNAQNYLFSSEVVPFHWDGAFYKEPKKLLFYCTQSEGLGGETLFTDTEKIWESLSESEKEACSKVTMVYRTEKKAHYGGEIKVPLVQKHPDSGKTILRIAERVQTSLNPVELEIIGVPHAEELYECLREKLYDSKYLYEHSWEAGDLVVADNFTYLHGRRPLGNNKKRSFKRIQIL